MVVAWMVSASDLSRKKLEGRIRQCQEGGSQLSRIMRRDRSDETTRVACHVVGASWRIVCLQASSGRSSAGRSCGA